MQWLFSLSRRNVILSREQQGVGLWRRHAIRYAVRSCGLWIAAGRLSNRNVASF